MLCGQAYDGRAGKAKVKRQKAKVKTRDRAAFINVEKAALFSMTKDESKAYSHPPLLPFLLLPYLWTA
jgi:hypothetical protein